MWWFNRRNQHLPEAAGTYAPGCTDVMLDYGPESLFMRFYYPTNESRNNLHNSYRWIPWTPSEEYIRGYSAVIPVFTFVIRFFNWWFSAFIPAIYGSKPKTDKKLKCIVLSHGLGGHRSFYSNICCELASRGYLVIALEHKGGSSCYTFYYNSKEEAKNNIKSRIYYEPFETGKDHHNQRKRQVDIRAKECNKVLDFLINLNNGKVPYNVLDDVPSNRKIEFKLEDLTGNIDLESLTMAGHSFGGATALLTLSQRKEFKQGILMDPWMFPIKDNKLEEKINQPLLFINTQTFHIASNVSAMSKFLTNKRQEMYTILHTTHEHQGDTVLQFGSWLNWFMRKIDPLLALKINNSLILNFLDKYVDSPSDISDCKDILEKEKSNYESGLTKPWA